VKLIEEVVETSTLVLMTCRLVCWLALPASTEILAEPNVASEGRFPSSCQTTEAVCAPELTVEATGVVT